MTKMSKEILQHCVNADIDAAYKIMAHLWKLGYSTDDIISIVFRVCKTHSMPKYIKLEFIKEIGYTYMRLVGSIQLLLQLSGLLSRLCHKSAALSSINITDQ
ncbi:Replication factor C subunit 2 [Lamellibrachia satsuma]|nr:Replication factor C subunit 2 [Lamellibrachia satsuma]